MKKFAHLLDERGEAGFIYDAITAFLRFIKAVEAGRFGAQRSSIRHASTRHGLHAALQIRGHRRTE
jgi:hypothetical protein